MTTENTMNMGNLQLADNSPPLAQNVGPQQTAPDSLSKTDAPAQPIAKTNDTVLPSSELQAGNAPPVPAGGEAGAHPPPAPAAPPAPPAPTPPAPVPTTTTPNAPAASPPGNANSSAPVKDSASTPASESPKVVPPIVFRGHVTSNPDTSVGSNIHRLLHIFEGDWAMNESDTLTSRFRYTFFVDFRSYPLPIRTDTITPVNAHLPSNHSHPEFVAPITGYFMIKQVGSVPDPVTGKWDEVQMREPGKNGPPIKLTIGGQPDEYPHCPKYPPGVSKTELLRVSALGRHETFGKWEWKGWYDPATGALQVFKRYLPPNKSVKRSEPKPRPRRSEIASDLVDVTGPILERVHPEFQVQVAPEIAGLMDVYKAVRNHRYRPHWFVSPVDANLVPDYYTVIKNPMCLNEVEKKLVSGEYKTPVDFFNDMNLVWQNAMIYNAAGTPVYNDAKFFENEFAKAWERYLDKFDRSHEGVDRRAVAIESRSRYAMDAGASKVEKDKMRAASSASAILQGSAVSSGSTSSRSKGGSRSKSGSSKHRRREDEYGLDYEFDEYGSYAETAGDAVGMHGKLNKLSLDTEEKFEKVFAIVKQMTQVLSSLMDIQSKQMSTAAMGSIPQYPHGYGKTEIDNMYSNMTQLMERVAEVSASPASRNVRKTGRRGVSSRYDDLEDYSDEFITGSDLDDDFSTGTARKSRKTGGSSRSRAGGASKTTAGGRKAPAAPIGLLPVPPPPRIIDMDMEPEFTAEEKNELSVLVESLSETEQSRIIQHLSERGLIPESSDGVIEFDMDKLPNKELRALLNLVQGMVNSRSLPNLQPVTPGPFPPGQALPPPGEIRDISNPALDNADRLSSLNTLGQSFPPPPPPPPPM